MSHRGPAPAGAPTARPRQFWPSARRLVGRLSPQRGRVGAVIGLAVLSVALTVLGPRLLGRATDIIFTGFLSSRLPAGSTRADAVAAARAAGDDQLAQMLAAIPLAPGTGIDLTALAQVLSWAVVVYVAASALSWLQGYLLNDIVARTVYRLRADVEDKLHRLPLSYFDRHPRGELLSRVTNDIDNISQSLQQTMSQLITSLLTVIGVLAMMFVISPLLALVALLTVPVAVVVTALIARRSQPLFVAQWQHTGELNAGIEEAFTGHTLITVFDQQESTQQAFLAKNDELFRASFGAQFVSGTIMPMMMFAGNLNYLLIAVVGGLRVASGTLSLGDVQAFIQYSRQFTQPLSNVASMANLLQSGVASAERVFRLLDAPEQSPDPAHPVLPAAEQAAGRVAFEHVSFRYAPERPLIEDLSLVAEPGQRVAIVGPTGAGKTTLVNLILRFYELDAGRITLDGVDITTMRRADLRSRIGMVLQDSWLFHCTIRDIIAYGRPDASEEQIRASSRAAYVDRFVHALPQGYDTVVDEDASNLSAGERQLITIARAFLADPALLILDEATSSVDTRTELLVQKATAALRANRTSFVIAHRLSTIRDADLILMMERGRIVEQGTHEQLLARHGAYWRLYSAQFHASGGDEQAVSASSRPVST
jgi:ATP-binding cassette subfamily B protein